MQKTLWKLLLALTILSVSCSNDPAAEQPAGKTISVTIGSTPEITIRPFTSLDDDGISVKWETGDKIALWAVNASGGAQFTAQTFKLWHYNQSYNAAKFTANINPMPEGEYTYYAVSPTPTTVNGTQASYTIPSAQQGTFSGAYDVMVAEPVAAGALTEGDNSEAINLRFSHKMHVLKIRIPANNLGEPIEQLELTFPQPVVGTLTVDASAPAAAPVLTNGSEKLILTFATPLDAGATVFAMIAPIEIPSEQAIGIKALGATSESKVAYMAGKNFAAGHTTPIALTIPELGAKFTHIKFSLPADKGTATLGEEVTKITLTAPEGATFGNGSNVIEYAPNAEGNHTIYFRPTWEDKLSGQHVAATYESASAIVSKAIAIPTLTPAAENIVQLHVPYLMEENFNNVTGFSNHDNAATGGVTIDTYVDAIDLSGYGLSGWSGTRCGADVGNAFRICVRTEDAWVACPRYQGRLDTAPLSGIKAGANVKVLVSFNYSLHITWDAHKILKAYGYHTSQGLIASINSGSTALANPVAKDISGSGGSYESIGTSASYTIPACTNEYRLAWNVYSSQRKTGNSNGWCYIDNIKVTITK